MYFYYNSEADKYIKLHYDSPAIALTNIVFPTPGFPVKIIPLGI